MSNCHSKYLQTGPTERIFKIMRAIKIRRLQNAIASYKMRRNNLIYPETELNNTKKRNKRTRNNKVRNYINNRTRNNKTRDKKIGNNRERNLKRDLKNTDDLKYRLHQKMNQIIKRRCTKLASLFATRRL